MKRYFTLCLLSVILACSDVVAQQGRLTAPQPLDTFYLSNMHWKIGYNARGINIIESVKDVYHANLLNGELGDISLAYKPKDAVMVRLNPNRREMKVDESTQTILYRDAGLANAIELTQRFRLDGEILHWDIDIVNNSKFPMEIADLSFAFPTRGRIGADRMAIFQEGFFRHAFISGDASFTYYTRLNGEAPNFLLTVKPGTKLEYFDPSRFYIYSGKTGRDETRGTWRQEHTRTWLQPAGSVNDKLSYGLTLHIADTYQQMKEILVNNRLIDIDVVPGMTLPINQKAKFSLQTLCSIDAIEAEFPAQTTVKYLGKKGNNTHLYEVEFRKLGENKLTVYFDGGRKTYLEFFSCEPLETINKKRSSFLVNRLQFRDPTKWYNGLYGLYDMKSKEVRSPDNQDTYEEGSQSYVLASDDPILGRAPFLASMNVAFPNDEEIASLEYHLKHFVWGGLQRTDKETPYPYGVYGIPTWIQNRDEELRRTVSTTSLDKMRVWRTFDYGHVIMMWWHMYQIAKLYPEKCKFMTADQYLEIAYQTAKAFYIYPAELLGNYYEPYKWGCYNELVKIDIIDELEAKGFPEKAADLRAEWEKKAKYFIYDDPYPYRSEMVTDRTAFESSYYLAKYGLQNDMKPDEKLWYDPNEKTWYSHPVVTKAAARDFMERQLYAALSTRGYLEKQWYKLGGDASMSYMARMGSTPILDYGFRYADDPYEWTRLGYAGHLGPYGLANTGTPESNYGYWFPGKENDGAIGQSYISYKFGSMANWGGAQDARGAWKYDMEGDLGWCAITRTAVTMLVEDPIFGWTVFGGNMTEDSKQFAVSQEDGVRIRFRIINDKIRVGVELDRDNWSATSPVIVNKDMRSMELKLVNAIGDKHTTRLTVNAIKGVRSPKVSVDGRNISFKLDRYGNYVFAISVERPESTVKVSW